MANCTRYFIVAAHCDEWKISQQEGLPIGLSCIALLQCSALANDLWPYIDACTSLIQEEWFPGTPQNGNPDYPNGPPLIIIDNWIEVPALPEGDIITYDVGLHEVNKLLNPKG